MEALCSPDLHNLMNAEGELLNWLQHVKLDLSASDGVEGVDVVVYRSREGGLVEEEDVLPWTHDKARLHISDPELITGLDTLLARVGASVEERWELGFRWLEGDDTGEVRVSPDNEL